MRVRFHRIVENQHFILDEDRIKSLVNVLQKRVGKPSILATCTDEGTRSFESVEDLLQYENPKGRSITSLEFECANSEKEITAIVEFRSPRKIISASGVAITVSSTEDQATIVMKEIEEIALGIQPWYSRIAKMSELFWWILYMLILPFPNREITYGFFFPDLSFFEIMSLTGASMGMAWGTLYVIRLFLTQLYL